MELEKLVERRDAEIRELQREFWRKCVAAPDLAALSGENEQLARRACDNSEHIAALRVEGASIIRAYDADQQRTAALQAERRTLLERIGGVEQLEAEAREKCEAAESRIEVERQRLGERAAGQEELLESLAELAQNAERDWAMVEAAVAQEEVKEAAVEADACAESRAAGRLDERHRLQAADLDRQLEQERRRLKDPGCELRRAEQGSEVAEARARVTELRHTEASLVARLAESRRRGEETERKAMGVARELVDSSQAIAWLRADVEAKHSMRAELEEVEFRNGLLRQSVQDLQKEGLASSLQNTDEEEDARTGQTRVVNEALSTALEAEAWEHRTAQQRLEALQIETRPVHQYLMRLSEAVRHWREDFVRMRYVPGSGARLEEPELAQLKLRLPVPAELSWEDADSVARVARSLSTCFEALASESSLWLKEAESENHRRANTESLLLQAERLALHEELERLAPRSAQATNDAPASPHALSAISKASSASSPKSALRACITRSDHERAEKAPRPAVTQGPVAEAQLARGAVQQNAAPQAAAASAWPASPVPQPRETRSSAGRSSNASMLSSVSLHDRRISISSQSLAAPGRPAAELEPQPISGEQQLVSAMTAELQSETPGSSAATRRFNELQRKVNELTRQAIRPARRGASSGPLYRVEALPPGSPDPMPRAMGAKAHRLPAPRSAEKKRQAPALGQSCIHENAEESLNRFDDYSVHRPRHQQTLM